MRAIICMNVIQVKHDFMQLVLYIMLIWSIYTRKTRKKNPLSACVRNAYTSHVNNVSDCIKAVRRAVGWVRPQNHHHTEQQHTYTHICAKICNCAIFNSIELFLTMSEKIEFCRSSSYGYQLIFSSQTFFVIIFSIPYCQFYVHVLQYMCVFLRVMRARCVWKTLLYMLWKWT